MLDNRKTSSGDDKRCHRGDIDGVRLISTCADDVHDLPWKVDMLRGCLHLVGEATEFTNINPTYSHDRQVGR